MLHQTIYGMFGYIPNYLWLNEIHTTCGRYEIYTLSFSFWKTNEQWNNYILTIWIGTKLSHEKFSTVV